MKILKAGLWVLVLLLPSFAVADSCTTMTVSGLPGTTCTIGDKSFTFSTQNATIDSSLAGLIFTPITTNPLSPGFSLTASSPIGLSAQGATLDIYYTVGTISGDPTLTSATINLINPNLTGTGTPNYVDAFNLLATLGPLPEVCISTPDPSLLGCSQTAPYGGTYTVTRPFAAPVNTASGDFGISIATNGTGTSTFNSAEFFFNQTPTATPEPGTLLLMASGIGAVVRLKRRHQRP